jgi:branched-chain amino acid transport system permease protein
VAEFLLSYQSMFDTVCIFSCIALSQYVALRGGLFAISTAGFVAIGAYVAAIALTRYTVPMLLAEALAAVAAIVTGLILALPLARLRGHFQAIATLAFVEIVRNFALYADSLTGGARGINAMPKVVSSGHALVVLGAIIAMLAVINRTGVGRAFDAIRQDETVARSLGISVTGYQTLAFALSAGIAGIGGAMLAFNTYSIAPEEFGFPLIVAAIGAVVLGGRDSVAGPIVGTAILVLLPELARPLADNRILLYGAILIIAITYLPRGIVDALKHRWNTKGNGAPAARAAAGAGDA